MCSADGNCGNRRSGDDGINDGGDDGGDRRSRGRRDHEWWLQCGSTSSHVCFLVHMLLIELRASKTGRLRGKA